MNDFLNSAILQTLAMAPTPTNPDGTPAEGPGALGMFVPMILMFVIFYFILIRPQQKAKREQDLLIEKAKSGDDVILSNGFLGTIANVKDKTFIVKIADNVKVEVLKSAVQSVTKPDAKA